MAIAGFGFGHADGIGHGGEAVIAQGGDVAVFDDRESAFVDVEHLGAGVVLQRLELVAIAGPAGGVEIGFLDVEKLPALGERQSQRGAALLLVGERGVHVSCGIDGDVVFDGVPGKRCGFWEVGSVAIDATVLYGGDAMTKSAEDACGDGEIGELLEELGEGLFRGGVLLAGFGGRGSGEHLRNGFVRSLFEGFPCTSFDEFLSHEADLLHAAGEDFGGEFFGLLRAGEETLDSFGAESEHDQTGGKAGIKRGHLRLLERFRMCHFRMVLAQSCVNVAKLGRIGLSAASGGRSCHADASQGVHRFDHLAHVGGFVYRCG